MTDSSDSPDRQPRRFLDLSATQLIGGALAAATAAALGSRLGLVGTILGAATASLISAVMVALFTASIERSRELIKNLPAKRPTTVTQAVAATRAGTATLEADDEVAPDKPGFLERMHGRWRMVAVTTATVFVLAGVAITGTELITGHSLDGSSGTTAGGAVKQVKESQSQNDQPSDDSTTNTEDQPTDGATSEPATGNDSSDDQPADKPTDRATDEPTEEPTDQPTEEPTDQPTEEPSDVPTAPTEAPTASSTP